MAGLTVPASLPVLEDLLQRTDQSALLISSYIVLTVTPSACGDVTAYVICERCNDSSLPTYCATQVTCHILMNCVFLSDGFDM